MYPCKGFTDIIKMAGISIAREGQLLGDLQAPANKIVFKAKMLYSGMEGGRTFLEVQGKSCSWGICIMDN